jgi:signal transduction histidine kinase
MTRSSLSRDFADPRVRPILWRLPLFAVVLTGLLVLNYLDRLLVRDFANEARTQAVQTDALLESFLRHRFALIQNERALSATARTQRESRERFAVLADEIIGDAPDMFSLYLLDSSGAVLQTFRRDGDEQLPAPRGNHLRLPDRAEAIHRARETRAIAVTRSLSLAGGGRGMVAYIPIIRRDTVVGYVGGAFAYQTLFNDALAGQLQGRFGYRIRDALDEVIAVSPEYPENARALVQREVSFDGSQSWMLDVAIPPFDPLIPRLVTWCGGALLLVAVILLVIREEARARRFAAHSVDLELLSRDLLDANVRLEDRARQIAEANRAKSRFLANVSHELRTPLNAIVGYNSLAIDGLYGVPSPQLAAAHERIRAAAEHLLALVNDVLDLSKIEVGRMEIDIQPTDIPALIDSVVTVVSPIASAKGLTVDAVLGRGLPRIETDARHVRQILLNLASNASKFTDRGCITITARPGDGRPGRAVRISVDDTGIGIAPEDQERIFEEFEQVRPSGRGDSLERGTGLGLAIARKLARLLGGDVDVESRLGHGSRFTLHLPLVAPRIPRDEHSEPESTADGGAAPTSGENRELHLPADATRGDVSERSDEHAMFHGRSHSGGLDGHHNDG